jgi:hypothetical protein
MRVRGEVAAAVPVRLERPGQRAAAGEERQCREDAEAPEHEPEHAAAIEALSRLRRRWDRVGRGDHCTFVRVG